MAEQQLRAALHHLCDFAGGRAAETAPDAELLGRFVRLRDGAAFAALVRRHGPMVLGLCRRVLRHAHDAEDAFQATFLVLARKAASVRKRGALASWLHGVAYRVATTRRRDLARRAGREVPLHDCAKDGPAEATWRDVRAALDEELARLPDRYRAVLVLCYLEGKTRDEAARALGWSLGALRGRLERGRDLLRARLVRRGLGLSSALLASALGREAGATVPPTLAASAAKAATLYAVRRAAVSGVVPARVVAQAAGVVRAMTLTKVKYASAALAVSCLLLATGALRIGQAGAGREQAPPANPQPAEGQPPDGGKPGAARLPEQVERSRPAAGLAAQPRPAEGPALPRQEALERFHKMSPEERLNHVAKTAGAETAFVPVVREDLSPTVVARGSVESADAIDVLSRVKGQATVKWVADDGTPVRKGERLIELDDSALREQLRTQKVALEQAQAARLAADANLRLARKEGELAVRGGELGLKVARLELKRDDGKDAERKEVLGLKVEQAQLALETARLRGRAGELKADAELKAKAGAEEQEVKRKDGIEAQLAECVIKAPRAGLVIHHVPEAPRSGGPAAALAVGEPVREGQKLLRVCGLERFTVLTQAREADISRLRVGQAAQVRVDAFPAQVLRGRVQEVSPVASQRDWLARGVKVYPVVVGLSAALPGLRPGMSAEVGIAEARLPKVLQVPVGSVARVGREAFCYVRAGKGLQERKVTLGARGARNVEIKEGLKEGEEVLRAPGR